jgi:DNA-directed RNA polymerase specialized sigma subunit
MQYKTIVHELLQQQTELHDELRLTRRLLPTIETLAKQLKGSHEVWKETLSQSKPSSDPSQIASEALELAVKELEDRLQNVSQHSDTELPTLDQAMAYLVGPMSRD